MPRKPGYTTAPYRKPAVVCRNCGHGQGSHSSGKNACKTCDQQAENGIRQEKEVCLHFEPDTQPVAA